MTPTTLRVVLDDRADLSRFASEFADVERFGALRRGAITVVEHVARLCARAGLDAPIVLRPGGPALDRLLGPPATRDTTQYLIMPTYLAITAPDDAAVRFLRRVALLTQPVALGRGDGPDGAVVVEEAALQELDRAPVAQRHAWLAARARDLPLLDDDLALADLHEPAVFLDLLSGNFAARHFNDVEQDQYFVVKRSRDVEKMRREHAYYGLLPAHLQPYFVQPFGFAVEGETAHYRMHRLLVPDVAVQWVHRAFAPAQFDRLAAQLMRFVDERTVRGVSAVDGRRVADALYGEKVDARLDAFLATDVGARTDALLRSGGHEGGLPRLRERYAALRARLERGRRFDATAVTHGDFCFSNILYNPAARSIHLIDPRGALVEDELYSDPYYDLAKLSHSVLGGYDLIVAARSVPGFDDALGLRLRTERPADPEIGRRFAAALGERGYEMPLVRVYEASLFLSMLPLHVDAPRRVLALALRAAEILDGLDQGDWER